MSDFTSAHRAAGQAFASGNHAEAQRHVGHMLRALNSKGGNVGKKNFIQSAIKHPGIEKKAAAKAGESTHAYMEAHKSSPGKAGARARLGLRLSAMAKSRKGA